MHLRDHFSLLYDLKVSRLDTALLRNLWFIQKSDVGNKLT